MADAMAIANVQVRSRLMRLASSAGMASESSLRTEDGDEPRMLSSPVAQLREPATATCTSLGFAATPDVSVNRCTPRSNGAIAPPLAPAAAPDAPLPAAAPPSQPPAVPPPAVALERHFL